MRYGVTFNQAGQIIPAGFHIPQNLAWNSYVPHPLQLSGHVPMTPVLGGPQVIGFGKLQATLQQANFATAARMH